MGLSLPSELTTPMSWLGLDWPQADEDLLRETGEKWIEFGNQLSHAAQPVNQAARDVWSATEGDAAEAFRSWWSKDDGPEHRLSDDAKAALLIGGALLAFAAITLTVKLSIIAQLIILAAEVAQAIATAFVTFGATSLEVPGFVAASRLIVRRLIKEVLEHVQKAIREVLDHAKSLFKRGSRIRKQGDRLVNGRSIPGRQTEPRYNGKPMGEQYRYETDGSHPKARFRGSSVRRLSEAEQEQHRVFVDEQGLLRNAKDGSLFDTSAASTAHNGGGKAIFVQDEAGNLYASNYQEVGVFHHSTLANGKPMAAAGEIMATNGRLDGVTAASGHYMPGPGEMKQFTDEMARHGLNDVPVYGFDGVTRWN